MHFCPIQRPSFLAVCAIAMGCVSAQPVVAAPYGAHGFFDIKVAPGFSDYRTPLVDFLKTHEARRINNFCILGEEALDGTRSAWVIWREGQKMILWDGGSESLAASRRILDMKRDVVPREADVKGSTYLVTRDWVATTKRRCERSGTQVQIPNTELK